MVLTAPLGGLVSGQSALLRLAGSTPEALTVKQPVAMHMVYPTGRPSFSLARLFEEPELKTFEERLKDRRLNQEKELRRLGNLIEDARALGQRRGANVPSDVDLAEEALGAVARGELPVVMRADAEDEIRGAVRFAGDHGLKLIIAGGLEAWRCADLLKEKDVSVLLSVDRLPRRESDRYDAAFTNPSVLHRAGVRFAIVSDDAADIRNLPYEAAMARAYGLPAEVALRAITLSPAKLLVLERVLANDPHDDRRSCGTGVSPAQMTVLRSRTIIVLIRTALQESRATAEIAPPGASPDTVDGPDGLVGPAPLHEANHCTQIAYSQPSRDDRPPDAMRMAAASPW